MLDSGIHPPDSVGSMSGTALLVGTAWSRGVEGTTRYTPPSEFILLMLLDGLNFFMFMGRDRDLCMPALSCDQIGH